MSNFKLPTTMSSFAEQLKKAEKDLAAGREKGSPSVSKDGEKVKKLREELAKPQPHPVLQFNEVAQCVSVMSVISLSILPFVPWNTRVQTDRLILLVMATSTLPIQFITFYRIFSTLTMLAVTCYVARTSVIYYGYQRALVRFPKRDGSGSAKVSKAAKKPRQDLWVSLSPSSLLFSPRSCIYRRRSTNANGW